MNPKIDISEAAKLLGLPTSALRYYDRMGLASPKRSRSGYRSYSLVDLTELTDIVLLRNAGVPVKTVERLMNGPIEESIDAIDAAESRTIEQLERLNQSLELLSFKSKAIRKYFSAKATGPRIVSKPGIERLFRFDIKKSICLDAYLKTPQRLRFATLFEDPNKADQFLDCSLSPVEGYDSQLLWERDSKIDQYVEVLLETDYYHSCHNNLDEHVGWMNTHGLKPGKTIAEYLTFGFSKEASRKLDYYLAWIEIL